MNNKKTKILVTCCYCGPRRSQPKNFNTDRLIYIKNQLNYLSIVKNNLDKIVFVINIDNKTANLDYSFINNFTDFDIDIIFRDNSGYSYGAFSCAYEKYRTEFDYYIYHEDDWVWIEDNWDSTLERLMTEKSVDYISGGMAKDGNKLFASVAEAMIKSEILESVYMKYKRLPYPKINNTLNYNLIQELGQKSLGFEASRMNKKLCDWLDNYRTLFWCANKGMVEMNPNNIIKDLVIPYQAIHLKNKETSFPRIERSGRLVK